MSDTLRHDITAERAALARLRELLTSTGAMVAVVVRPVGNSALTPTAIANAGPRELRFAAAELLRQAEAMERAEQERPPRPWWNRYD